MENAPVGGEVVMHGELPTNTPAVSPSEAAAALSQRRWEKARQTQAPEQPQKEAPVEPQQELAETPDDAQPQADPVEPTETPEPAQPTIEPPRSWTKDEKERFQSLPRETQEYIASREQDREREIRRSQNEAAEARKASEAKLADADKVRKQYEDALPALLQTLQATQAGEFSDIRTMQDVEKMAREDWPRYVVWDAQQKKIAAIAQEVASAKQRQEADERSKWVDFSKKEDAALFDRAPELSDKDRRAKVAQAAVDVLKEIGFGDEEISQSWSGEKPLYLRDHRLQLLILDGVKYREAKAAKPAPKPVPQVQRPGVAEPRNAAAVQTVQSLSKKLESTGSINDAVALVKARRAAAARRA